MSSIDSTPENKNFLNPNNFRFTIKKAPHVNFFIQRVNLPSMDLPDTNMPTPFVKIPYPGEHIIYGPLTITFKVDEDLRNYMEIQNWLSALGKPLDFNQYANIERIPLMTGDGITTDISLSILSSAKEPNYEVTYMDAFPVSISELTFNTTNVDVNYIEATATFKFLNYKIVKTY
jgi:hypothetical protein